MPVYMESDSENVLTARITGEIDHHSAKWLRADIDTAINDSKPMLLKLDFSGVTFMDSSGVGLVMGRNVSMKEIGGRVELINMPPFIEKVMAIAGMDKLTGTDFSKGGTKNGR
ncbi:MAG: STAS domain-containing protein [Oscillospiraceae bacterium]|nr:STAS domain-containing protein [Oscillospiraceae bacterium]